MGRDYPLKTKTWSKAGFTLLEALITLSIFAVVLVTILQIYDSNQQTYVRGEAKVDLQQNVRVVLGQIAADIHLAGFDPNNAIEAQTDVKYPLQPIPGTAVSDPLSSSELRLIGDVDGDGSSDCVSYYLDATNKQLMQRKTAWTSGACTWTGTGSVVADNITGLTFTYSSATGGAGNANPTDLSNQAKRVRVVITGTSSTYGMTFTGDSEAAIRQ